MCRYSEQSFGFVSPISAQESLKPCRENHQSWMAHQTALQNGTQENITICPTAGLPSTYRIQRSQCCSMCSSSRLLWMCLLKSVSSGLGNTFSGMSASWLPEYSSLVVSKVNGKVTANITSIFSHSVTCLGTDKCCWDRNHMPGWFMNAPQYLLVKVQLVICFQTSLSHKHVQPALGCALHPRNS